MTRAEWLDLGLRVLADEGPSGLTVARLCHHAGKTRGSLYHHFSDHEALLRGIVERWSERFTDEVVRSANRGGNLDNLAISLDFEVEQAVRRLAVKNDSLMPLVRAVDSRRIAYLSGVRAQQGLERPNEIAEIEYAAFLGFQQLDLSKRRLGTLAARFAALVERR